MKTERFRSEVVRLAEAFKAELIKAALKNSTEASISKAAFVSDIPLQAILDSIPDASSRMKSISERTRSDQSSEYSRYATTSDKALREELKELREFQYNSGGRDDNPEQTAKTISIIEDVLSSRRSSRG